MKPVVKVEIFGIADGIPQSSGCGCGPQLTMYEMYSEFQLILDQTGITHQVDLQFIDISKEDITQYEYLGKALDRGYHLPLTAVNERVRFHSSVPSLQLYQLVQRSLTS